jgi:molybdopterin molybdotransferase
MTSLLQALSCADGYDPESLNAERAHRIILDLIEPVQDRERLPVRDALGRVLAEDVISTMDVPGHDNSAMDGYALRFADLAAEGETLLHLAGTAFAGRAFAGHLGAGECVRIMTGGVIPEGADTVVIQEVVQAEDERIVVPPKQRQGQHVRRAGEDLRTGTPALRAGKLLRPAELGLIASLGVGEVVVRRRPRVAFFSTGDELCLRRHAAEGRRGVRQQPLHPPRHAGRAWAARSSTSAWCATTRPRSRPPSARRRPGPTPSSPAAASRSARPTSSAA